FLQARLRWRPYAPAEKLKECRRIRPAPAALERSMIPITETDALTPETFRNEVLLLGLPVVVRGLVREWPVVRAAQTSDEAFCDYIRRFDRGYGVDTFYGAPS